jgi:hypothetical protein
MYRPSVHIGLGVAAVLGLFVGSPGTAQAHACDICPVTVHTYHPAHYTTGAAGDVALQDATSPIIQQFTSMLGMSFSHAAVLYDASGSAFTESTWDGAYPPSSRSTGEPHVCSRVVSPFNLQRMFPGALNGSYNHRDALKGVLVKGAAAVACIAPDGPYANGNYNGLYVYDLYHDNYHFNSIKNRHHGGSCAALAEDDCGVAVTGPWQRTFSYFDHYNVSMAIYQQAYNAIAPMCSANYPFFGCGGVPALGNCNGTGCSCADRGAAQVVNEFVQQSSAADGWDGLTDLSVYGQYLGESKANAQIGTTWWVNNYQSWTPRVPDNIKASILDPRSPAYGKQWYPVDPSYNNLVAGYWTSAVVNRRQCCHTDGCQPC